MPRPSRSAASRACPLPALVPRASALRRPPLRAAVLLVLAVAWAAAGALPAAAQYFGRNKVQYDDFDFERLRTDNFDIYYYDEEREAVGDAARMAQRWYRRHAQVFQKELDERRPLIFYANDADFQQTNVISGFISQGTGGVTESLKERVVMPLTGSYQETDHVLGHELVHSFQYDFLLRGEARRASGLPLWLIEGMAEYLSVGRMDSHTSMWLRDALLRDDLPSVEDLTTSREYFPYRYGQAYMAYIGGKYGDATVPNLFRTAAQTGLDSAFVYTLGVTADSLSNEWRQAVRETYGPLMEGRTAPDSAGRSILSEADLNLAPSYSPDGQYVAFISELDLFTINLFVADAETGEVIDKLEGVSSDPHFDAIRFIASSGTWSPDGQKLAFVTFAEGDNELSIWDLRSGDIERHIKLQGVGALSNPAWSPDGSQIVVTGLDGGISDLYLLDLQTNAVRQLTNDRYADLQPTWSPDGRTIAFTTDRGVGGTDFSTLTYGRPRLALLDVETGAVEPVRPFEGALHHNPQFSPDGQSLYFIADQDGFKDIYRLDLTTGTPYRITYLKTGVSGITALSPAMTVAGQNGRMAFSVFYDNEYTVYGLEAVALEGTPVAPGEGLAEARVLPPVQAVGQGLVGNFLEQPRVGLPEDTDFATRPYKPRLKLDYVAPPSVGVSAGGGFGTQFAGGVALYFSDMLSNHNLAVAVQAQGRVKDIGGQVSYLNRGDRLNYGVSAGHIPLLFGGARGGFDGNTQVIEQIYQRIYVDQANVSAQYPLSITRRLEVSAGATRYGFDYEVERYRIFPNGQVTRDRESLDELEPDPVYFAQAAAAFVGDYSFFGVTSPVRGGRYRFQVAPRYGSETYVTALADYRRYFYAEPFTFAVRGLHTGNYGADEDDAFATEYLGYTYYPGFVRGYGFGSFDASECTGATTACPVFDRLTGTRIVTASAEVRVPLLAPRPLGLIDFPYLPVELNVFGDAGLAWTAEDAPVLKFDRDTTERVPVFSAGASTRVNLLGYLVFEIYYAYPFQRPEKGAHWGFQLSPGW